MQHNKIDLAAEVQRADLPEGLNGFLFPLYEAISNSLHSIEERWEDDLEEKGCLNVTFEDEFKYFRVSDNGMGLNEVNLKAFLTPLTGNKLQKGGKGFGRFIAFKIFAGVFYTSLHADGQGGKDTLSFEYKPFADEENLCLVPEVSGAGKHMFDQGMTVLMKRPVSEYEDYFLLEGGDRFFTHQAEDILQAVLDHFLIEFIQKKVPKRFLFTIQGVEFNLYDYFYDALKIGGSKEHILSISEKDEVFKFDYFQVDKTKSSKHRLYFYANSRASSDLENISTGLNKNPFSAESGGRRYYYLVAVSGDFFKSSQSRDRIINVHKKINHGNSKKQVREILIDLAKKDILEIEVSYTKERRAEMHANVEHIVAVDPLLRRGLGTLSIDEFVEKRNITETKEQLAQDLFIERERLKFDFSKLDRKEISVDDLVNIVKTKIPEDAKEALAVYVAYRNRVIKIFRKLLTKDDEALATESMVHELIYPRYKDSEETDYSSHNLWLLDDDLAYAKYISSDRTPSGNKREKGQYAHDLLINNDNELMVVEMKRPQKDGYDNSAEGTTNNPVVQLKEQISAIREKGKIKTSGGKEIEIETQSMVRGYVLADWNDSLKTYLKNEDFILTKFGGHMAYRYYQGLNLMLEVIAFDRLIDRAEKRNSAFTDMLEGKTNYDRSSKSPL